MPTDNPKISLYVPQKIYDRFKEFQESNEKKLSMSQAGTIILAEYFGEKEILKGIIEKTTQGTTIGGVTLARFEELENKVKELEELIKQEKNPSASSSIFERLKKREALRKENNYSRPPVNLLGEPQKIEPLPATFLSEKRFGLSKSIIATKKTKLSSKELSDWTKEKDPDGIAWILTKDKKGYIPKDKLSDELLIKLQKWITQNR